MQSAAEMWNKRFSDDGYLFGTEPNVWLREHSNHAYPVGCQSSFWVNPFAAVEHFVRGSLCVGNQSKN